MVRRVKVSEKPLSGANLRVEYLVSKVDAVAKKQKYLLEQWGNLLVKDKITCRLHPELSCTDSHNVNSTCSLRGIVKFTSPINRGGMMICTWVLVHHLPSWAFNLGRSSLKLGV